MRPLPIVLLLSITLTGAARAQRYRITEEPGFIVLHDETGGMEAAVAPASGGELSSLRLRYRGRWIEFLYRARDYSTQQGWRGKAPFLWPATGRSFPSDIKAAAGMDDGFYDWKGRRYPMPLHGFARDLPWKVDKRAADCSGARVSLSLADTAATRRQYPFGFHLQVEYGLSGGRLSILYTVSAAKTNSEAMFFSAGNHITFRTPFVEGSDPAAMLFETPSTVEYLKTETGLPTGKSRPRSLAKPVRLGDFDTHLAVSLGGYRGDPYMRLTDPAGLTLRMTHHADSLPAAPVVQFNLWGDARQGYFSPEPFVGLQNSFNLRKGLVFLQPGDQWHWRVEIQFE